VTHRDELPAWRDLFQFNWDAFNVSTGVRFSVGIVIGWILTWWIDGDYFITALAALLAWLTDAPGTTRNRALGIAAFGILGIPIAWIAAAIDTSEFWWVGAMFVISFVFTMPMALGVRPYMVGWSAILWFLYAPLFTSADETSTVIGTFLLGVGIVLAMTLVAPLIDRLRRKQRLPAPPEAGPQTDLGYAVGYSLTLAVVMATAILIGLQWLEVDPTWVGNGAFFVLGPSTNQTWIKGLERAVATIGGLAVGFLLIQFVDSTLGLIVLGTIVTFTCAATMNVSYTLFVGSFTAFMAFGWALKGFDTSYYNTVERLFAEALAIILALSATWALGKWAHHRQVEYFVEPVLAD
jgi:hypothetical protein